MERRTELKRWGRRSLDSGWAQKGVYNKVFIAIENWQKDNKARTEKAFSLKK